MPFAAKSAAPCGVHIPLRYPALERAAEGGITLFAAPPGYLLADTLAATLANHGRSLFWLRVGPEDNDPATLLISLIAAAQRIRPDAGASTLDEMRRRLNPAASWAPLFTHLAHELAATLPADSALVIEHCHHLHRAPTTLALLCSHFLPVLPIDMACILTDDESLPPAILPTGAIRRGIGDLRLDTRTARSLADYAAIELSSANISQIIALTEGRAAVFEGLCAATALLGPAVVRSAAERAGHVDELLARIARAWLATMDSDGQRALALMMRIEYAHPDLARTAIGVERLPHGPWLQQLTGNWTRLRRMWHAPLRAALRAGATPDSAALGRAAEYLAANGGIERAVPLYFELGDCAGAARVISEAADALMRLSQWETLRDWLDQLPAPTLRDWPWLAYVGGEVATALDDLEAAQRAFAIATALFTAHQDADGACQSLLAESTLAAWRGDYTLAQTRAFAASSMAEASGLALQQGWATWQLGCMSALTGDLDNALAYFGRASAVAANADDRIVADLLHQTEDLAATQYDLRRQREFYHQAYFLVERAELEAAERLRLLLSAPPDCLGDLLNSHGWSHTPLMLKLPALAAPADMPEVAHRPGRLHTLLQALGLRRATAGAASPTAPSSSLPPFESLSAAGGVASLPALPAAAPSTAPIPGNGSAAAKAPTATPASSDIPPPISPAAAGGALERELIEQQPAPAAEVSLTPTLTIHLLGAFRVALNDRPIESWPSGRGRAIFKYLMAHHGRAIPRDVLMDVFWPEASPDAARNNLNVAMHGLRQALKAVTDQQVVMFREGAYQLHGEIRQWLDVEEFERHLDAGHRFETTGRLVAATAEYEIAAGLYQGDFLADDPYEEWPVLRREQLRVAYLDTLDRLSEIYFSQEQYAACATLCQLMLARDNCREDAHCRLMRCYSRQGQHHLALRQYQICAETLRAELNVDPAPTTTHLYERIRLREAV